MLILNEAWSDTPIVNRGDAATSLLNQAGISCLIENRQKNLETDVDKLLYHFSDLFGDSASALHTVFTLCVPLLFSGGIPWPLGMRSH